MWYAAANHDTVVLDNPHRFNHRGARKSHLAFGAGSPHYCVGAYLARLGTGLRLDDAAAMNGDTKLSDDELGFMGRPRLHSTIADERVDKVAAR